MCKGINRLFWIDSEWRVDFEFIWDSWIVSLHAEVDVDDVV